MTEDITLSDAAAELRYIAAPAELLARDMLDVACNLHAEVPIGDDLEALVLKAQLVKTILSNVLRFADDIERAALKPS